MTQSQPPPLSPPRLHLSPNMKIDKLDLEQNRLYSEKNGDEYLHCYDGFSTRVFDLEGASCRCLLQKLSEYCQSIGTTRDLAFMRTLALYLSNCAVLNLFSGF